MRFLLTFCSAQKVCPVDYEQIPSCGCSLCILFYAYFLSRSFLTKRQKTLSSNISGCSLSNLTYLCIFYLYLSIYLYMKMHINVLMNYYECSSLLCSFISLFSFLLCIIHSLLVKFFLSQTLKDFSIECDLRLLLKNYHILFCDLFPFL